MVQNYDKHVQLQQALHLEDRPQDFFRFIVRFSLVSELKIGTSNIIMLQTAIRKDAQSNFGLIIPPRLQKISSHLDFRYNVSYEIRGKF